jgi:predicted phage terminase large subunit-like protein
MANKAGKSFLENSGSDLEMVRALRRIKTQKKELGQQIILHQFIRSVSPNYKFYKVHAELTKQLQRIIDGKCKRLIIQIPPRTGKSFLSSKLFPAAYLMAHPDRYAGIMSYSAELAEGFSRSARDYYMQAGGTLDPVKRAVNDWGTQGGGGLWAAGVGGAITGRSGHLLIVDDPVKNREDADSPRVMEKLWDWYTSTLYTRLEPNVGSIVVIQCMTGDTDVTMADGSRKSLRDIKPGDEILSWKDGKHSKQSVLNHACQGEDDVFELRTGSSRVKANARHPFLVQKSDGSQEWVRLQELRVGDELVTSSLTRFEEVARLTEQQAWLLGYMFGDGWNTIRTGTKLDRNGKRYSRSGFVTCIAAPKPEEEREKILQAFESIWGIRPKLTKFGYYRTERQEPGKWFNEFGLTGNAKTKRVPSWMYSQPIEIRQAFLSGYHEADGATFSTGRSAGRHTFGSCNLDLINDFRQLARGLGYSVTNASIYESCIQAPNSPQPIFSRNCNLQYNPWSKDEHEFRTQKIRSIKPVGREDVYDIQVEGTECFIADGLVSHNTRWSENDLIGRLIESEMNVSEKGRENWTILDLPAISEDAGSRPPLPEHCEVIPDWREEPGIALCPQRYGIEEYERIREAIGTRDFAALFQQRPAPEGGNMFDPGWWQYYEQSEQLPEFQRVMLSVDCTFTNSSTSDYVVGSVIGQAGNRFYVLDMVRERLDIIGTIAMISRMYNKHQLNGTIIELAASGYAAYQMLSKKVPGLIGFKPEKSKVARASGIVPTIEAGNVFLPVSAMWLDTFLNEFSLFPAAKNDDIVDSVGMAINYMSQRTTPQMTEVSWGRGVTLPYNVNNNQIIRGT